MKKIFSVLTLFTLSFTMTSCGVDKFSVITGTASTNETMTEVTTETATETTTETTTETAQTETSITSNASEPEKSKYASEMLAVEKDSITEGKLSPEHEFYKEVVAKDPECADYINEISIFDKEISDTFVIHVALPPEYDSSKKYPMLIMTDGIWRLNDHLELRKQMNQGEINPIITVSIGYPNGYDYLTIRERDFLKDPESYLHFIVDNLVPYLSQNYSIDSEDMTLAGHSYGGYWAFYALFKSDTIGKNTFKNYFIASPSLQASTGNENIASFEEEYHSRNKGLNCNVYVTVGGLEEPYFIRLITDFTELLKEREYDGLNITYEKFDECTHENVYGPSIKSAALLFYGK